MNNKIEIAKNSFWVGKVDDRPVPFHRLILQRGTTYNSYLLETEKPTLIDTVDISFGVEFVKKLSEVFDLNTLRYIVVNHVEPDHSGALPALLNKAKNAVIVTTEKARKLLNGMYKLQGRDYHIIKDGETLDIGGKTLKFFETPYLHTEETMITYCVEDKILYPCDIFSTHIATQQLFNDLAPEDITEDFKVYYDLIMAPHRPYVRKMLDKIKDIEINTIAPSHGYILRDNAKKFIDLYDKMSLKDTSDKKALIIFSSMTGNTGKAANDIYKGLTDSGITATIVNVKSSSIDTVKEMVAESNMIIIGSSTKFGDMVGNIEDYIKEIVKMDLSDKYGFAFGSYGWSGESIELINDYLKRSNIKLLDSAKIINSTGTNSIRLPLRVNFYGEAEKTAAVNAGKIAAEFIS
ncbi:FprA family A-type flavoprotein [Clostridium sp. JN-9]|uniref:FprA family A-type flavoprotein n=1 Tax=Clostridium sp. JN-9 TaxID=2507159 RepID=UPI000FFE1555|nr:FprA family A-type flavoprotein [Clostridium sp. JN-9]QAT39518.1 FprA family A-type flavoprotein [Clostridium sp. JN-9]